MEISQPIHDKAVIVEHAAKSDPLCRGDYQATYWLALACSLLTSPVKAEREQGKEMVRRWRRSVAA